MIEPDAAARRERRSQGVVNAGLGANLVLAAAKLTAGIAGASSGLVSDGINSISDTVYYLIVKIFIRKAAEPPDQEHPYGHTQLETIASLVVGAFVLTTAVAIFWHELNVVIRLLAGREMLTAAAPFTLWVALTAVAVKAVLMIWTGRRGKLVRNAALEALAMDHRNDLVASSAVAAGIVVARLGAPWVDPAAGALVAVVIFHTGIVILRNSALDLMDAVPGRTLAREILEHLQGIEEIRAVEEILAHRFGPYFVVNITIGLDGRLTIAAGDRICTRVENTLYRQMPSVRMVYVHHHPAAADAEGVETITQPHSQ